jgi:cell division protein FtsL
VTEAASRAAQPAGSRPRFTGRAAILAVVLCAIALSLAYPVREYIAQRRQIDQLQAQRSQIALQLKRLQQEKRRLHDPAYIERLARDRLQMCMPTQKCYVIIEPMPGNAQATAARRDQAPWYARLWSSVQQANEQPIAGSGPGRKTPRSHAPGRPGPGTGGRARHG